MRRLTLKKVNKKILKNLTGKYPDMVELNYLYEVRSKLATTKGKESNGDLLK